MEGEIVTEAIKKISGYLIVGLMLIGCLAALGCAGESSSSSSASEEFVSVASENSILVVGDESDSALNVVFTNGTGQEITDIAIIPAGAQDAPAFMMAEAEKVAGTEQVSVFREPVNEKTVFDVIIAMGETRYTLHNLDFAAMDHATIRLEGDVAYIETVIDGKPYSTLQEEYDIAHPPAASEEPVEAYGGEYDGGAIYNNAPVYDAPVTGGPDQSEDVCVDPVLR